MIVEDALPGEVPGMGDLEHRRAEFKETLANIAKIDKNQFQIGGDLDAMLEKAQVACEPMVDVGLRYVRRINDRGDDYLIVNRGEKSIDDWITLAAPMQAAVILDPRFADRAGVAATKNNQIYLQLEPGESCIVRTFKDAGAIAGAKKWEYRQTTGEPFAIAGKWQVHFLEGGPNLPADFSTDKLASWTTLGDEEAQRFAGTARYTIEFDGPASKSDDWRLDLGKVCESARVKLNGHDIGTIWANPFSIDVGQFLQPGKNTLELEITNLAANRIRDLDKRGVQWKAFHEINFVNKAYKPFDASDWPLRDSGLLGPVRLIPLKRIDPK